MAEAELGLIGLGVMGRNLALNIADRGFPIAVWNRTAATTEAFAADIGARPVTTCATLDGLIGTLRRPRLVLLMVPAGEATEQQIEALTPLLAPGDVIVDGGNARYQDTARRATVLASSGIHFIGAGISGGEEGARHGPAIMAGGAPKAYARVQPVFEAIAAKVDGEPCCALLGPNGAGHFVKMLHNGIEYAEMQLIAEIFALMRDLLDLGYPEMQAAFARWNEGDLGSYLIEITAGILGKTDPETGQPMVEVILDKAGHKGTGVWAVIAALELGVAAPTIAEAVAARALSAEREERLRLSPALEVATPGFTGAPDVQALHDALLAAKVCVWAQGFAVMAAASRTYGWGLDLGTVARIWRGGCIIRARLLEPVMAAYKRAPDLPNLLLDPHFASLLARTHAGLRRVVALGAEHGVPLPALASALAWLDGARSARLPASLLQAQRDWFGAHTYERVDQPGRFHSDWSAL